MERNTLGYALFHQAITGWLLVCDETEAGAGNSDFQVVTSSSL